MGRGGMILLNGEGADSDAGAVRVGDEGDGAGVVGGFAFDDDADSERGADGAGVVAVVDDFDAVCAAGGAAFGPIDIFNGALRVGLDIHVHVEQAAGAGLAMVVGNFFAGGIDDVEVEVVHVFPFEGDLNVAGAGAGLFEAFAEIVKEKGLTIGGGEIRTEINLAVAGSGPNAWRAAFRKFDSVSAVRVSRVTARRWGVGDLAGS